MIMSKPGWVPFTFGARHNDGALDPDFKDTDEAVEASRRGHDDAVFLGWAVASFNYGPTYARHQTWRGGAE